MPRLSSTADLARLRRTLANQRDPDQRRVMVCGGTGCRAKGAEAVITTLQQEIEKQGLQGAVQFVVTGCHGFCERGPVVVVKPEGIFYQGVTPADVPAIVSETVACGRAIERLLYADPTTGARCRSTRSSREWCWV